MVELYLQEIVIEVSLGSHGDQHDSGTSFSPWDQIGVVLVDRKEDHGLLRIHSVVVLDVLQIVLVDLRLCMLLVCS